MGDKINTPIKKFDYKALPGFKRELHNISFGKFYWQQGVISLAFKPYQQYIILGEPYCLSSWILLLLIRIQRKKAILWTHGWYGRENRLKRIIKKIFFNLSSCILSYSEYAIRLMQKEGIPVSKMKCIANSLDSEQFRIIRQTLQQTSIYKDHFHNTYPTIIYCGRVQRSKKLEILIDCLQQLETYGIQANMMIVGKDVDGVNLDLLAKERGLQNRIWFYGPCYDNLLLGEMFYNASICVSPGNVGLTAIHSLSFGCPVVTHNNFANQGPEFESIQDGVTGSFFKENDIIDLVEKIKFWLTISPRCREYVRKCAYAEIDRKWNVNYQISLLKQILNHE